MPRDVDPRTVVGGRVHALACHVTSEAEAKRVYGSNWKSATINGTVLEVRKRTRDNNKNVQTYVYASYMFPTEVSRQKELHLKRCLQCLHRQHLTPQKEIQKRVTTIYPSKVISE